MKTAFANLTGDLAGSYFPLTGMNEKVFIPLFPSFISFSIEAIFLVLLVLLAGSAAAGG